MTTIPNADPNAPLHKRLWRAWLVVGHKMGTFNARVILSIFYLLIVAPYAIVLAPFWDPMRIKKRGTWTSRRTNDLTLEDSQRQF